MHLRKLQAVLGSGGPCQSSSQGRRADRADSVVHLHSGSGLVSPDGSSIATLSLPALVHQEGRTIVRRHVDDAEAGQLRGENPTTVSKTDSTENLDHPAHRASQPNRVIDTSAGDPGLQHLFTIDSPGGISPAGPLANALQIYETRTKTREPLFAISPRTRRKRDDLLIRWRTCGITCVRITGRTARTGITTRCRRRRSGVC